MNRKIKRKAKELAKETGFERTSDGLNRTYWLCGWNKDKDKANLLAKEKEKEGYVAFASDDIHERKEGYGVYIGKENKIIEGLAELLWIFFNHHIIMMMVLVLCSFPVIALNFYFGVSLYWLFVPLAIAILSPFLCIWNDKVIEKEKERKRKEECLCPFYHRSEHLEYGLQRPAPCNDWVTERWCSRRYDDSRYVKGTECLYKKKYSCPLFK